MDKNKTNILNRILLLVGSVSTFSVGFTIVIAAICYFDTLTYSMGMQVAPPTDWIIDTIVSIIIHGICGIVLISYSIYVFINFYVDKEG